MVHASLVIHALTLALIKMEEKNWFVDCSSAPKWAGFLYTMKEQNPDLFNGLELEREDNDTTLNHADIVELAHRLLDNPFERMFKDNLNTN